MKNDQMFRNFSIRVVFSWFIIFTFIPFFLVVLFSFFGEGSEGFSHVRLTLSNYVQISHPIYFRIFIRSFELAAVTSLLCLLLGYPFAYYVAQLPERWRTIWMFLLIIPFWTSSLIRLYAIIIIIRAKGLVNNFLLWLGVIHHPFQMLYTEPAILLGLTYSLLPFMILPLYANLEKFDWQLLDAARDLGASRMQILYKIVLPLTCSGIVAGIILVLLPAMTMFYIPDILGGSKSILLGNLIKDQFIEANNWPFGSTVSIMLTVIMSFMLILYWKVSKNTERRELL